MLLAVNRVNSYFFIVLAMQLVLLPSEGFTQSRLKNCPTNQSLHYDDCFGTYKHENIGKYVGEFQNNQYNGQGTYFFDDGRKYVGEFRGNEYNGHGTYTHVDGGNYVGEFRDNQYNGQGTYSFVDGRQYVGEFRDNEYNGHGTYTYVDGGKYVGEFRDNKYNGQGTLFAANGTIRQRGIFENNAFMKANSIEQTIPLLEPNSKYKPGPAQQLPEKSELRR